MVVQQAKITKLLVQFKNWKEWLGADPDLPGGEGDPSELKSLITTIITVAASLLAVVLVGVVAYGGFLWITAGDSEEQLQKAKKVMKSGIIGIVIVFGFIALLGLMAAIFGVDITNFGFLDEILGS